MATKGGKGDKDLFFRELQKCNSQEKWPTVLEFSEIVATFVMQSLRIAYIFVDESVIAFYPCIEIWKISLGQGEQSHSSPCIRILIGILYAF